MAFLHVDKNLSHLWTLSLKQQQGGMAHGSPWPLNLNININLYKPHSVPDLLRNAGFRAVLQSSLPSAACVAANGCDRATRSQDQQPGAINLIIRSIPWPDQNNQPFGSTFSPLLTDSGVCFDICRSCSTCDVIIPDA